MDQDSASTVIESSQTEAPVAVPAAPETSPASESVNDVAASSSDAPDKAETRESLLDVVKAAVAKPDEASPTTDALAEGASPAPGENTEKAEGELPEEPSQEELQAYTPRTRRRIDQLLNERRALREEVTALKGDAETARSVREFLVSNDIGKDDFGLVLDLAAAMRRGDFKAFLEGVTPYVQLAQESLGIVLPADLQQAVDTGHMTTQAAQRFAQERSARQLAEAQALRVQQLTAQQAAQQQEQVQQQSAAALQRNVETAVQAWENSIRQSDPDFAHKEPVVRDLLPAVVQERGIPRTPEEAVAIAKEAYDRANRHVRAFQPRPKATQQVPSSTPRVVGARPEPRSMMEAVQQALGR